MPKEISLYEADLLAAELNQDVPSVDLHGMREEEARQEAEWFVNAQFAAGRRVGRIIHGKGSGLLRKEIHALLAAYKNHGIVADYRDALPALGGVTVFALHPHE